MLILNDARKTILYDQGISEDQQFGASESELLLVKKEEENVSATIKRSLGRRKKESHIENKSKENTKGRSHEPQDLESPEKSFHSKANHNARQNHSEYGLFREKDGKIAEATLNRDIISNKYDDHIGVLEVFRVEKDLLLKLLRDLDISEKGFKHASNNKARLTKSGSFPLASSSQTGFTTLNHKKNEVWPFPKSENSIATTTEAQRICTSHTKEMPVVTHQDARRGSSKAKPGVSYQKGWNQLVLHRFKAIKQKIKHALAEFTKNGHLASPDYRLPSKNMMKEVSQNLEETKASDYRRTSSINESLDKYTQLFEQSFRKGTKWNKSMSKSLKLIDEDTNEMSVHAPKFSRRNLSLPNLDPLGFLLHEAIRDTSDLRIPGRTSVENNTSAEILIHLQQNPTESEIQDVVVSNGSDVNPKSVDSFENEVMEVLETSCENYANRHREGTEINSKDSSMNQLDTNVNAAAKGANKSGDESDNHLLLYESDIGNDFNFKYVKNVIELSGLLEENEGIQNIVDQPLNGFKELETFLQKEMEWSREEIISKEFYDHQLLFNLANEVLLQIYEKSSIYFPRPFSFNLSLHPKPKGSHLLKQVWNGVELYLKLKPELDQTLEDVVSRDLAHSGWMNLQWEEEFVVLELEDMIVEDLLHEVFFS
ncbi:protein TRM32-like [Senna tora]|uniref:Protein TRM32-like n=1 Tax=Senna tora TaxID=362788 RepID=A0A834TMV8_9FABA|nr:protein TRM32-like [Senna tora]